MGVNETLAAFFFIYLANCTYTYKCMVRNNVMLQYRIMPLLNTDNAEAPSTVADRQRPKVMPGGPRGLLTWHNRPTLVHVRHHIPDTWTELIHTFQHIPHWKLPISHRLIHMSVIVHVCLWSSMFVFDLAAKHKYPILITHICILPPFPPMPKHPAPEFFGGDLARLILSSRPIHHPDISVYKMITLKLCRASYM